MRRLEAVAHRVDLLHGATYPAVFQCEPLEDDGTLPGEYVVKFKSETSCAFELMAWRIAEHLDVPTPGAALIRLGADLADAMTRSQTAERVRNSTGWNFGSERLEHGYATWLRDQRVPANLCATASKILAFDVVVDNSDRSRFPPGKINLLYREDHLVAIDHEKAFTFTRLIETPPSPFRPDLVRNIVNVHPLAVGLTARRLDLGDFVLRLSRLTEDVVERICAEANAVFPHGHQDKICEWFARARSNASSLPTMLSGCLL